jgi:uncharacterized Rmd1/YagE family protein
MTEPKTPEELHLRAPGDGAMGCRVHAEYFAGQIGFRAFRARYPHYPVLASDPLVVEPERGSYAVLTKFGGVAFWNCEPGVIAALVDEIGAMPEAGRRLDDVVDDAEIHLGETDDRVTFDAIHLRRLTLDRLKLVSMALCQSVALEHFEKEVIAALERFAPVIAKLRARGRLLLSENVVLRHVGFALEVRAAVLANLTLIDQPPELWEDEALARLHAMLREHFDLDERSSAIDRKLAFLNDVNATLMDALNTRKSHRLEWIIIILIAVEIVLFIYKDFLPIH